MIWSNWTYLGVGVGLGIATSWLFTWLKDTEKKAATKHLASQEVATLLKQLQQTELAYQMLQQISQFKAGFLVRTAHELRSPLNSLIGLHQLILSDLCDDPAEEREFITQAYESALKLMHLIDKILDVARAESGNSQPEIQPLQLSLVLEEVYNLIYLVAANRNLPLQILPPDPEIYILADPRWLRQILVNLIDNCIQEMSEGSINIVTKSSFSEKIVYIYLDAPIPIDIWSEPVDLITAPINLGKDDTSFSSGLTLILNQTLLELMKCSLEMLPASDNSEQSNYTRLQITIPLIIPETAFLDHQENQD